MSATGRGKKRRDHDAYYTPNWCVDRLMEDPDLPFDLSGLWLEPCAGGGDIAKAIKTRGIWDPILISGDIRGECSAQLKRCSDDVYTGDFRSFDYSALLEKHNRDRFDVLITNPPFSLAEDFMAKGMKIAHYTCLFLRINFLASKSRCSFLRMFPPDVFVLPNRPSFTGNNRTDATEYAWFIWPAHARDHGQLKILARTAKAERIK